MEVKVVGFVPGVDMVDGKCDVAAAHYFLQVYADGDVYTVRRSAMSFFELEAALIRRFPKLGLDPLPLNECEGAASYQKLAAKKKRKGAAAVALLSVDDLSDSEPKLTQWLSSLVGMAPVLSSDEMRRFITDDVSTERIGGGNPGIDRDSVGSASSNGSEYERKRSEAFARFTEGDFENILLERAPMDKVKVQPGGTHTITLTTRSSGSSDQYICWAFTTLAGKTNPAKDVAFSVTFADLEGSTVPVRPYERHPHAATQLIKGCWQCPGQGTATLTWHNDYSKWYAKHVAFKAALVTSYQISEAAKRQKRRASAMLDREDQKNALNRVMQGLGGEHGGTNDTGPSAGMGGIRGFAHGSSHGSEGEGEGVEGDHRRNTGGEGDDSSATAARSSKGGGPSSNPEVATLRKENATLKGSLAELSLENTHQREQIERLANDAAALDADDAEKRLVALGQQLARVQSELASEQRAHQHTRDQLMTLQQRWQEKADQLARFEQQHAATDAQAQKLKEEKRILKAVAKQYKEEAERQGHDLIMLRNHVAFAKEKEAAAVAAAEAAAAAAAAEAAIASPLRSDDMPLGVPLPPPDAPASSNPSVPPVPLLSFASPQPEASTPEPPPTATAAPMGEAEITAVTPAVSTEDASEDAEASIIIWAGRVQAFYARYCPAKATPESCKTTARKFHGRESDLFTALFHKYSIPEDEQAMMMMDFAAQSGGGGGT